MGRIIIEPVIHLIIVLPILLLTLKNRSFETLKVLLVFVIFFLAYNVLLRLPIEYSQFRIIQGSWNWSGKIFAILGSLLFLLLYRNFQLKDYYLTLKQNKTFLKKGILIIAVILFISSASTFIYGTSENWKTETVLFQLTMPGIDEEIAYRGIMLGLLRKILTPNLKIILLHPAILVTGILFGFAHGLSLTTSFHLNFNLSYFFQTLIIGMIWAWITIKSGSILLALISHNMGNTITKLILMKL